MSVFWCGSCCFCGLVVCMCWWVFAGFLRFGVGVCLDAFLGG